MMRSAQYLYHRSKNVPVGVVKKNVIGARRIALSRRSCSLSAQSSVPLAHRNCRQNAKRLLRMAVCVVTQR